jgi:hypothetical protein
MKRILGFASVLVLACAPAFAGSDSQSVTIAAPVKVGATQLPAGTYKVTYTGAGSDVLVTLSKNGKAVASSPAKVVAERNQYSGVSTQTVGGVQILQEIQLSAVDLILADNATVASTSGH